MTPRNLTPRADLPSPTEGDDFAFNASFTKRDGSPYDITNWTVSMTIAEQGADGAPIIERDITNHDDATGGKTSWEIAGSETAGITGMKRYDVQIVKGDGTTRTVAIGTIGFIDGVTDRAISGSGGSAVGATAGASIDVTLDGDDSVTLNVRGLTNYTDSDAVGALDGATITPGQVGTEADPVKQQHAEAISSGEVLTNSISVTNETEIVATMSSNQTLAAGDRDTVAFDNILDDNRGEFDATTHTFNPDKTARYTVNCSIRFKVGGNRDNLRVRLSDDDTSSVINGSIRETNTSGSSNETVALVWEGKLSAGTNYSIEAANNTSSDTLNSLGIFTYLTISRSVVGRSQ